MHTQFRSLWLLAAVVVATSSIQACSGGDTPDVASAASTGGQAGTGGQSSSSSTGHGSSGGQTATTVSAGGDGGGGGSDEITGSSSSGGTGGSEPAVVCTPLWSRSFGDANQQQFGAVALDLEGNIVLGGGFQGSVDFGGGPLTAAGQLGMFVAKLDPQGNHLWSHAYTADIVATSSIAVDAQGDIFVAGGFQGTVDFGGGPLTSAGSTDAFLLKLDADGNHVWSQRFGDGAPQDAFYVAVDPFGDIVVTGDLEGTADFGGGPLASKGAEDIFLAKLDSAGNHLWSHSYGGPGFDFAGGIAVDGAGNIVMPGVFNKTIDFGAGPLTNAGLSDGFVVELDPAGNPLWTRTYGSAGSVAMYSVALDSAGAVVVDGLFSGTVDFGGGPLTSVGGTLGDVFVLKLDAAGNHVWSRRFGGVNDELPQAIAVDDKGHVLLTGWFDGSIDFGGGALMSAGNPPLGSADIFMAKLDSDGNHLGSSRFGDASSQSFAVLAADGAGNAILAGNFAGTIDLGNGALVSAGGTLMKGADLFVARFGCGGP